MEMLKEKLFVTPGEFAGLSDSAAIQAAVNAAVEQDVRVVVINAKEDGSAWKLEAPVFLPDYMTVILDGSVLEAACTMFVNENADEPDTKCLGGEATDIYIIGKNGAKLVGTANAPQIRLDNAKNYRIAGLTLVRGQGISLKYGRFGKLQQLTFDDTFYGIACGEGCHNNIIEDIVADTYAESVLLSGGTDLLYGRGGELRDSIICRVQAKTQGAPAVAIYAYNDPVYNMIIRDITDTTSCGTAVYIGTGGNYTSVKYPRLCHEFDRELNVSDIHLYKNNAGAYIRDITVRGVNSQRNAVMTGISCDGVYLANLHCGEGCTKITRAAQNTREFLDDVDAAIELPQLAEDKPAKAFLTPNDPKFYGDTDAQTIQNAIDEAAKTGINYVVIPRWNLRTQTTAWEIEKAIAIPSNMTVELWSCYLRQADFVYDNMFVNANAKQNLTAEGADRNITITSVGNAILDGGKHNGLKEKNAGHNGFGPITDNAMILMRNVDGFVVENVHMRWARWYAMYFVYTTNGRVSNIDFNIPPVFPDLGGVFLRTGCQNFLVENLTGIVGEDLVSLTAQGMDCANGLTVDGKSIDIRNVRIRNIKCNANRANMIRLLTHDGRKIQNVLVEGLLDVSLAEQKKQPVSCVALGSDMGYCIKPAEMGDLSDVVIRDFCSRGAAVVVVSGRSQNVEITNCHTYSGASSVVQSSNAEVKNVRFNGMFFKRDQSSNYMRGTATSIITDKKKFVGGIMTSTGLKGEMVMENVFADTLGDGFRVTGGGNVEVNNFQVNICGRQVGISDDKSTLTVNGEKY